MGAAPEGGTASADSGANPAGAGAAVSAAESVGGTADAGAGYSKCPTLFRDCRAAGQGDFGEV